MPVLSGCSYQWMIKAGVPNLINNTIKEISLYEDFLIIVQFQINVSPIAFRQTSFV
jgi:hypothetical protein